MYTQQTARQDRLTVVAEVTVDGLAADRIYLGTEDVTEVACWLMTTKGAYPLAKLGRDQRGFFVLVGEVI